MGYASSYGRCGCSTIKIMESGKIIDYIRCVEHYCAAVDDPKIIEVAQNRREHNNQMLLEWEKYMSKYK